MLLHHITTTFEWARKEGRAGRPHADDPQHARGAQLRAGGGSRARGDAPAGPHPQTLPCGRPRARRRQHHQRHAEARRARGQRIARGGPGGTWAACRVRAPAPARLPAGRGAVGAKRGRQRDLDPHAQRAVQGRRQQRRLAAQQQRGAALVLACVPSAGCQAGMHKQQQGRRAQRPPRRGSVLALCTSAACLFGASRQPAPLGLA